MLCWSHVRIIHIDINCWRFNELEGSFFYRSSDYLRDHFFSCINKNIGHKKCKEKFQKLSLICLWV